MDTNFQLKSRLQDTGTIDKKLILSMGWSYFALERNQNYIYTYMHISGLKFPHARYKARDGHIWDCDHV